MVFKESSTIYSISIGIIALLFSSLYLSFSLEYGMQILPYSVLLAFQILIIIIYINKISISINTVEILMLLILGLIIIWYLITGLYSNFINYSFNRVLLTFIPSYALFLFVLSDNAPIKTFKKTSKFFIYTGVILSLIGIVIYSFGEQVIQNGEYIQKLTLGPIVISQLIIKANDFFRISSLTGNPNNLGFVLFVSIILTFCLYKLKEIRLFLFLLLISIQTVGIIMTFSRSSLLALLVALLLFYLLITQNIRAFLYKILTIGLCSVPIVIVIIFIKDRVSAFGRSSTLAGREVSWNYAFDRFLESPIFGIGFGISQEHLILGGIDISTHNAHLSILLETGLIGYLLFISLIILSLIIAFINYFKISNKYKNTEKKIVYSAVISILIAIIINQFFETKIPYVGFHTLFWIYFTGVAVKKL